VGAENTSSRSHKKQRTPEEQAAHDKRKEERRMAKKDEKVAIADNSSAGLLFGSIIPTTPKVLVGEKSLVDEPEFLTVDIPHITSRRHSHRKPSSRSSHRRGNNDRERHKSEEERKEREAREARQPRERQMVAPRFSFDENVEERRGNSASYVSYSESVKQLAPRVNDQEKWKKQKKAKEKPKGELASLWSSAKNMFA